MNFNENKLLLAGAGGHCRSVLDSIDRTKYTDIIITGLTDDVGKTVCGVPVTGTNEDLPALYEQGYKQAVITVGSIGDSQKRRELYYLLKGLGFSFPAIIDPSAIVSGNAEAIEEGVFIGKRAVVNTGVNLGACCIINSGAVIDHDCKIGRFVHIAPGVSMSGGVTVGDNSHIGTGSAVIQSVTIGANTVIGACSAVVKDIPEGVVAFGNPCRVHRKIEE